MTSLLPTQRKHAHGTTSLRKIRGGLALGLLAAIALIVWAERRWAAAPRARRDVQARAYAGPVPLPMKAIGGGAWLNPRGLTPLPIKAAQVQGGLATGAGYSSARGGPGSGWGPLGEAQNAPLPQGAWNGFNTRLTKELYSSVRPDYPLALHPVVPMAPDASFTRGVAVPRVLRQQDHTP